MFTVCPKCALTLVVTAADLRVAQGYVRCGRCSNVFNALSRLSEDRQAAATAAQPSPSPAPAPQPAPAPPPAPKAAATPQQRADSSGASGTFRTRETPARPAPPPPSEPKRYDDDSIPEEDLEFNPDATDLNKVFVEQPPSPQFTAATGTFKAIRLEAEASAREADELARTDERESPVDEHFDPTDTQVDVEIDPDLIATMTQLTTKERVNSTPAEAPRPQPPASRSAPPKPAPPPPAPPPAALPQPAAPKPAAPSKQSFVLQPPPEQTAAPPMRLAERAKARAEAARTGLDRTVDVPRPEAKHKSDENDARTKADALRASAFETSQAIRDALAPRRRAAAADTTSAHAEEPTSFFSGMWTAGSLGLLALLLIQIVHHYRHDLATNSTLNGPLTSIYAVLGVPIVPRWDLNAYEVRQLGASAPADAPGQITVRASVKNAAHQAQPLPLLRVTLQDQFGNRIASRDVPPQAYLPRAIPSSSLLSAGQRIDAEMTFVDPGSNAVGFEIDACMPAPEGGITCANDAAR